MIINKNINQNYLIIILAFAMMLSACGGKKKAEEEKQKANLDALSRPENIKVVAAIARVEPANGLIGLSSEVSGIVIETYKKEGDAVKKGDLIFKLDVKNEALDVEFARQQLIIQQDRIAVNQADIKQYEASLKEKNQDLSITEKLAVTGADTRQNVAIKQKERDVIVANLQSAKALMNVSLGELKSLKTKLDQSKITESSREVKAKEDGVLVSLEAKKGVAITAFSPFASLAPKGDLVLHGEIDEMFADRAKIGQEVDINYVGNETTIAKGKVIFLSPVLDNKSLFYEKTGETSDRRVRKFKVSYAEQANLLINAKVECKIKVQ